MSIVLGGVMTEYEQAISDYDDMICYANSKFISEEFPQEYGLGYGLYDLIVKYGGQVVLSQWKSFKARY